MEVRHHSKGLLLLTEDVRRHHPYLRERALSKWEGWKGSLASLHRWKLIAPWEAAFQNRWLTVVWARVVSKYTQ